MLRDQLFYVVKYIYICMHKFCTYVNFCVSFDRYMHFEKSVVDLFCIKLIVFWIKLIVLCSTVHMDLCTQVLDFCECRSTKFLCKF